LFIREGKKITLSPAGVILLEYSQKMLNLESELRSEVGHCKEKKGLITVKMPETLSTYYFPEILLKYNKMFSSVSISLTACSYFGLNEELQSGIVNLAFLITDSYRAVNIETSIIGKMPLKIVANPGNPLCIKDTVSLADIRTEPFYVPISDCNYFRIINRMMIDEGIEFSTLMKMSSVESIKKSIIAGTGISLLTEESVADCLDNGQLSELKLENGTLVANIIMIWLKNKWHPPILKEFMNIVRENISMNARGIISA
ncbi:MAG TPA: LysR family transcriptional regulator substrate-binding protein, partial [Spirochaetota bacterium]|nr:LysR family transcriptional regulator substrate-binding protein [Spirochaetota bacterium]